MYIYIYIHTCVYIYNNKKIIIIILITIITIITIIYTYIHHNNNNNNNNRNNNNKYIYLSESTHTEYQPSNSWNKIICRKFWGPLLQGKLIIAVALRRLLECTKTFADHGQNPCYIGDSMPWFQSLPWFKLSFEARSAFHLETRIVKWIQIHVGRPGWMSSAWLFNCSRTGAF